MCPIKKAIPIVVKRHCQTFKFDCFNSLMRSRMRNSLLHRDFLRLRCKLTERANSNNGS